MKPLIVTLATTNPGKIEELTRWVTQSPELVNITLTCPTNAPVIEETGQTFLENALLKAQGTDPVAGSHLVLAEDSGLIVEALDGTYQLSPFPGIYANRWLTPALRNQLIGNQKSPQPLSMPPDKMTEQGVSNTDLIASLLVLMQGVQNRSARYCCGMVLLDTVSGETFQILESSELWVTEREPAGSNGFGYDPIMYPVDSSGKPTTRTMAELAPDEKNRISHRGKAFLQVINHLKQHV